jgi:hypothetical protein
LLRPPVEVSPFASEDSVAAVKIEEISELHYITPMTNVPSILQHGILSHNRAAKLKHDDISMREIQDVRAEKRVPGGLALHDYANLYFNARNKMMAKKRPEHDRLCVLRVSTEALNIPGAVLADQNASSKYVLFLPSPLGLQSLTTTKSLCVRGNVRTIKSVSGGLGLSFAQNSSCRTSFPLG